MFLLCLITAYTGSNFEMRKGACTPFVFCLKQKTKLKHKPCYTLTILKNINYTRKRLKTKRVFTDTRH